MMTRHGASGKAHQSKLTMAVAVAMLVVVQPTPLIV